MQPLFLKKLIFYVFSTKQVKNMFLWVLGSIFAHQNDALVKKTARIFLFINL
jgi:hypothetical protein